MVFSSLNFLCIFLPAVFGLYLMMPGIRAKNLCLILASLAFYAYGEPVYVFLMIGSAFFNYILALLIQKMSRRRKLLLAMAVSGNLGILAVFKYAGFLTELVNNLLAVALQIPNIKLPIGISFFTFQIMSYVLDVYSGEVTAQRNFGKILLYISFFPQLIAGPIVKYHDIEKELEQRNQSVQGVCEGIRRFLIGLGKKILIANYMGAIADGLFSAGMGEINILSAWLGAVSYMIQIYFDFSGYSDMAIGLGRMFGFHFWENFNYPYTALSIKDFWRRWHISLSGWFREYLYIPLGGNRKGKGRTCLNKILVFACTGIWHGANLTFLFWGLYHGAFLMLEEFCSFFSKKGGKWRHFFMHIYVLLVVLIGFVFFRADSMFQGLFWVKEMFVGFHFENDCMQLWMSFLTPLNLFVFCMGVAGSIPLKCRLENKKNWENVSWAFTLVLLLLCMMNLADGTYNPFIYFRF